MNARSKLGTERIGKLLISLAIPTIIAQVVNMLYNIVDRIYIGRMPDSSLALSGLAVALPVITIIMALTQLFGIGGAPLAAIKMGQDDKEGAEKILANSFSSLIISGVIITIIVFFFAEPILYLFGADDTNISYAVSYISIYSMGTICVQIAFGMNAYINTQGKTKIGMATVVIGAALNIALDPLFIFVFDMGVQGAALATVISQTVSAIWALKFFFGKGSAIRIRKEFLIPKFKILFSIMSLGISPFIMSTTESLLQITFINQLSQFGGTMAVGTMAILLSLYQMITFPINGFCQGAQPIMSFNYGAGNFERVRNTFKLTFKVCVIGAFLGVGTILVFAETFVSMFATDPDSIRFATWALRVYLMGGLTFGMQMCCQQSFMALGQARNSLSMAIFRKIILLIPLLYILPATIGTTQFAADMAQSISDLVINGGAVFAVFLAESISDVLAAVTTTILFMVFYKRNLKDRI